MNNIIPHILTEQHGQVYDGCELRILSYPKPTPSYMVQAEMSQTPQFLHRLRPDQTHSAAAPSLHAGGRLAMPWGESGYTPGFALVYLGYR